MKKTLFLVFILAVFFIPFLVTGQVRDSDINLSLSPLYPAPFQDVRAVLSSQTVDLNKTLISWSLDGQVTIRGVGKKDFQFKAGALGSVTNITASIETIEGVSLQKNISVKPAEIDMLWEAPDSYVPPFYKGKALASSQSKLKVVAMPSFMTEGGMVKNTNLSYIWSKDGKSQSQYSGWGKNYIIFQNSYLDRQNEVSVQVSDITGNMKAGGLTNLTTGNPKILFYRSDPIFGTDWGRALSTEYSINPDGETIIAEPYFFSEKNVTSPNISMKWFLNGQEIDNPAPKNALSLILQTGEKGTAIIKTTVENTKALFQESSKELRLNF
ncbi:MAG TPA: hypothetical protein VFQ59_01105 [Candidatus Paceibacterota bacterium]|nr:hypothetical protein [Candidatus Paceibacterota bacterium]